MEQPDTSVARPAVEVRRSARRRRTVSAYREDGVTIVLIPARMSRAEERRWVDVMVRRLDRQDGRRRPSDDALLRRARELSGRHLDGRAQPSSVRWVTNQRSRWGSCSPADGSIRLSDRLQAMPAWVVDYVLFHELVHLLVVDHSPAFWSLVARCPRAERARGYLEGVAAAGRLGLPSPAGAGVDGEGPDDGRDGSADVARPAEGPDVPADPEGALGEADPRPEARRAPQATSPSDGLW